MKIIRHSVFETNSSSSHSISIAQGRETYNTIFPDGNGAITLKGGCFGRNWWKTNDPVLKTNYLAVYCSLQNISFDPVEKVLQDHTGAVSVILDFFTYANKP